MTRDVAQMPVAVRRTFQILGPILLIVGLGLIVMAFLAFAQLFMGVADFGPDSPDFFPSVALHMMGYFALGAVVSTAGSVMIKFGYLRAVSGVVATETAGAMGVAGKAVGQGLKDAGFGAGQTTVKVKCRACGFLETEDAKFCSQCAQPM